MYCSKSVREISGGGGGRKGQNKNTEKSHISRELRTKCVFEYKQPDQEMENERQAPKKGQRTNGPTDMLAHVHPVPEP